MLLALSASTSPPERSGIKTRRGYVPRAVLAGLNNAHMEAFQKMVKLEEYLGNEIRYIQWTLEVKKLSHQEFMRLARNLDSCEKLHMMVLDKVLPY